MKKGFTDASIAKLKVNKYSLIEILRFAQNEKSVESLFLYERNRKMSLYDLIKNRRTVRKFKNKEVLESDLIKMIEGARLSPSAANLQSLRYMMVTSEDVRRELYPHIKYAGYTPEWNPTFEETPTAFLVVLNDNQIRPTEKSECDSGLAMMSISLLAEDLGYGSCIFGAIDRYQIKSVLGIDDKFDIMY